MEEDVSKTEVGGKEKQYGDAEAQTYQEMICSRNGLMPHEYFPLIPKN
jgi:hypothetical protein